MVKSTSYVDWSHQNDALGLSDLKKLNKMYLTERKGGGKNHYNEQGTDDIDEYLKPRDGGKYLRNAFLCSFSG